ncbi:MULTISPECIES: NTP transferase domain-containing protein [Haloferax]|uniref:NTP transferase domain-containing protein n=1 Tax=Haloferax marinum TaxID=2666143 RepID=A0A6A8G5C3_9EURY|nr:MULTISPECIES: NTP transferase domain-containing protein [Haloferax]KAB1198922.1 NTP transferase domain-containing protein [Haloferax sp. CBA1150]MRW96219.1 NTP transferase domain-containing protein [Haloferax marinum]
MCGGRGTRLAAPVEKPLVEVCGRPMFDRIVEALRASRVETVHAVTSPHTPETRTRASELGVHCIDAPGAGYVSDLGFALDRVSRPVVTVVADLPLLTPDHVDAVIEAAEGRSLTACVPVGQKRTLGSSLDDSLVFDYRGRAVCPTGLGVVGPDTEADPNSEHTEADPNSEHTEADPNSEHTEPEDTDSTVYLTTDFRLALNVNRPRDIVLAEDRCE